MGTMTLSEVVKLVSLSDCIFVRDLFSNDEWKLLKSEDGETFTYMSDAIRYVRANGIKYVQLSSFQQALMDNAEWDNF